MGKVFVAASTDRIWSNTSTDLAGFNWLFGTQAVVMVRVSDPGGNVEQMIVTNTSGTQGQWFINGPGSDEPALWDTGLCNFATGAVPVGVPVIIGWTKPTGDVTPRGHIYRFDTNTWTHVDGTATQANSGTLAQLIFGTGTVAGNGQNLDAEVWAYGMWQRNMTDKEFERLAAGNWLNTAPDFYEQWTDGREATVMKSTLGKFPVRQSGNSGTSRGSRRPPPGFRMCVQRRRR